jgi:parvulin-like peptidyl-prolyl isomerase
MMAAVAVAADEKPDIPGEAVVATLNGKDFTASEIVKLAEAAPFPQAKTMFERQPKEFLKAIAVLMLFSDLAQKQGLDKQSPYKEVLEFYRQQVLAQAMLNTQRNSYSPSTDELKKYYETHVAEYREAKVRMIYFPFSDEKSEAAAKQKATAVAGQARLGADFVTLAKANSEDPTGAGAEFAVKPDSAQPPPQMKAILLQSKAGAVTEPLRHDNGYYVFRVESMDVLPYEKVRDQIYVKLQDERFRAWHRETEQKINVQIKNEAFFQSSGKQ